MRCGTSAANGVGASPSARLGLAARLVKVTERLAHDAPGLEEPGSALIAHYLSPQRHPADRPWVGCRCRAWRLATAGPVMYFVWISEAGVAVHDET